MAGIGTHRTTVVEDEGEVRVAYHSTTVFTYYREKGIIVLNSGGYRTATTKRRINQACREYGIPVEVKQKGGEWYIFVEGEEKSVFYDKVHITPFRDEDEGREPI